jgi:sigma-54 dependent transcriptional regulator, flagellar regulatory protein
MSSTPVAVPVAVSLGQPAVESDPGTQPPVAVNLPVDLPTMLRQLEDAYIRAALTRTQFNKKEAAKLLGMGRTTLVEKLRRRNLATRSA